jgi:hypothetical protein
MGHSEEYELNRLAREHAEADEALREELARPMPNWQRLQELKRAKHAAKLAMVQAHQGGGAA